MEKTKNCDRCGWPLEPTAVRGGLTRHTSCRLAVEPDEDMLVLTPADPKETE